jgi:hypothetical protein
MGKVVSAKAGCGRSGNKTGFLSHASAVNGGVKAGHWGGAKTGQFCGVGIEHDAPVAPAEMAGVS